MSTDSKGELVDLIIRRAFEPVMHKKGDGLNPAEQDKLAHVQKATQAEIDRFHGYDSAQEVLVNFRRDLNSEPAQKIHRELKAHDLPTINDIRDEVEEKALDLGVSA